MKLGDHKTDRPRFLQAETVICPLFSLGIACEDEWVEAIHFLQPRPEVDAQTPLAKETVRQLHAWLENPGFVFDLPLKPQGTLFQRRVWQQIAAIAPGRTRTYGELAKALGSAPRAVGQACGANPLPIIVPCHRVVAAQGGLGGFARHKEGFLLEVKRWLLDHERRY